MNVVAVRAVALVWGFAEATLFFVIPDVWITYVALRSTRESLRACAFAVVGALCGGALIHVVARHDQTALLALFDRLPAIGPALIARVHDGLESSGVWAVMAGGFTGVPYKLYAAQAGEAGLGLVPFLAISVPARGLRFVLLALIAGLVARRIAPRYGESRLRQAWLGLWILNYMLYWNLMPG